MSSGAFEDDTVSTIIQSVNCYGNETKMLNCSYSTSDLGTCLEHSAAVICQGEETGLLEIGIHLRYRKATMPSTINMREKQMSTVTAFVKYIKYFI